MHQVVLTIYYLFWTKIPSQKSTSQKRLWLDIGNKPFSPLYQITPFVSVIRGPTLLALAGYKLVLLPSFVLFCFFIKTEALHSYLSLMRNDVGLLGLPYLSLRASGPLRVLSSLFYTNSCRAGRWAFFLFPFWALSRPILFSLEKGHLTVAIFFHMAYRSICPTPCSSWVCLLFGLPQPNCSCHCFLIFFFLSFNLFPGFLLLGSFYQKWVSTVSNKDLSSSTK